MKNMKKTLFLSGFVVALSAGMVSAQPANHGAHHHHTGESTAPAAEQSAFTEANERMMKDMHGVKLTGDANYDFVRGMIAHHQGAVDMAGVQLEKGKDPAIIALASAVIEAQEKEMSMMRKWLEDYGDAKPGDDARQIIAATQRINERMMQEMHEVNTGNVDQDFVKGMIPHHAAAVDMSYVLLAYTEDKQLRALAWDVIREQEQEIAIMKEWVKASQDGGKTPSPHQH